MASLEIPVELHHVLDYREERSDPAEGVAWFELRTDIGGFHLVVDRLRHAVSLSLTVDAQQGLSAEVHGVEALRVLDVGRRQVEITASGGDRWFISLTLPVLINFRGGEPAG